jgi:hypothetical protein
MDEIYCGPMDDVVVGFVQAYGSNAGEILYDTAKAGALAINQGVPVKCPETGQYDALAMLGDCGALLESMGLVFTENALGKVVQP